MKEWDMIHLLKSCLVTAERADMNVAWTMRSALVDIKGWVSEALSDMVKNPTDVVEVVTDGDYLIRFADGVEYSILEGVVPIKVDSHYPTSDIMFVMDTTTDCWRLVDWVCGITLMSTDEIVEFCKKLREEQLKKGEKA